MELLSEVASVTLQHYAEVDRLMVPHAGGVPDDAVDGAAAGGGVAAAGGRLPLRLIADQATAT